MKIINYQFTVLQFFQIGVVFYHTYHPTNYWLYLALIASGLKFLLFQWIIFFSLGLAQKMEGNEDGSTLFFKRFRFNSYISFFLGIMLLTYSFLNLNKYN